MSVKLSMISLDSCITDALEAGEQGIHKYKKYFNLAFRGMETLGVDFFYQIRSMKLPVSATKTVALPPDIVNYTKVGVFNSVGEVIPLIFNQKLTFYADNSPNRLQVSQDNTLDFQNIYNANSPWFYNYYADGNCFNLYGIPSGAPFVGSFNIDIPNGLIILGEQFAYDYICLEYIAAPMEGQEYYIPMQFREAMIAWILWQDIAGLPSTRRGSVSDKAMRKENFYNERRLARARWKPIRLDQEYEMQLMNQRMAVKA